MEVFSDDLASQRQMAIVEKFEGFVNYTYPIAINIRHTHHVVRDRLIGAMFEQVSLFSQAGKSGQVSRSYLAEIQITTETLSGARKAQDQPVPKAGYG
jgi:hypothetical protein